MELQSRLVQSRAEMDEAIFAVVGRDLQLDQMKAEFVENKQCDEARFYQLAVSHVNQVNGEHQQNFTRAAGIWRSECETLEQARNDAQKLAEELSERASLAARDNGVLRKEAAEAWAHSERHHENCEAHSKKQTAEMRDVYEQLDNERDIVDALQRTEHERASLSQKREDAYIEQRDSDEHKLSSVVRLLGRIA